VLDILLRWRKKNPTYNFSERNFIEGRYLELQEGNWRKIKLMKVTAFWDIVPCSLTECLHYGGSMHL
jgi:hypothetical protein